MPSLVVVPQPRNLLKYWLAWARAYSSDGAIEAAAYTKVPAAQRIHQGGRRILSATTRDRAADDTRKQADDLACELSFTGGAGRALASWLLAAACLLDCLFVILVPSLVCHLRSIVSFFFFFYLSSSSSSCRSALN